MFVAGKEIPEIIEFEDFYVIARNCKIKEGVKINFAKSVVLENCTIEKDCTIESNLKDFHFRFTKHSAGFCHSHVSNILSEGNTIPLLEKRTEIYRRHIHIVSKLSKRKLGISIMLVDILKHPAVHAVCAFI